MGNSTELEVFICASKANSIPLFVEEIDETGWSGRTDIILDHVYLGCTQRECKSNETIVDEHRNMFESRISAGATERLPSWEKSHANTIAWSNDMEGHAKKCVERYCELANETIQQLYNVSTPCAGLRMDGKLALDLWDLVIEVLHSSLNQPSIQGNLCSNEQSGKRTHQHQNEENSPTGTISN